MIVFSTKYYYFVFFVLVVVSMEANRRHSFQSDLCIVFMLLPYSSGYRPLS